jgi:hypothetical protein
LKPVRGLQRVGGQSKKPFGELVEGFLVMI